MRILWLGHNLAYPPKGGVLQRNYNLLREAARKCEVHVLAFDQPATRPEGVYPEECVGALRDFCETVEWVPLSRGSGKVNRRILAYQGVVSHDSYDVRWLRSHEMVKKLQKTLDSVYFDIVHFDTLGLAQYMPLVRNSTTVLNHHNIESVMMLRRAKNAENALARCYLRWEAQKIRNAELQWCPQVDINLVVSTEEEQELKTKVGAVRTAVIPNGVDTEYFRPRVDPGGKTLLFCGGLGWYPNIDAMRFFFNSIWGKLSGKIQDITIYVVGRNPPDWLGRLSSADSRIRVTGFVDDARDYFRRATAYVCPIRDGGGTRLKILEAFSMGIPVVSTAVGAEGLSVHHEEEILLGENAEAFATNIRRIQNSPDLAMRLIAQVKIVSTRFSWDAVGTELEDAYAEVVLNSKIKKDIPFSDRMAVSV